MLVVGFGIPPGAIPGEVLMIVLTVILAASAILRTLGLTKTSDVTKLQQYFSEY